MNLYYQWIPGAYSSIAAQNIAEWLSITYDQSIGVETFDDVRDKIEEWHLGILPIENSYAGSIHDNFYHFMRHDAKILGELTVKVNHALLAKPGARIENITEAYSHPQALSQCHDFLKSHNIQDMSYKDTAAAAQRVSQQSDTHVAAIASEYAAELYHLEILAKNIQDQDQNRTRFLLVAKADTTVSHTSSIGKTTILFETRDIPGALYKSLGCFATANINLTKIESIPSYKNPFIYSFWIDIQGHTADQWVKHALEELAFYTNEIKILGEY